MTNLNPASPADGATPFLSMTVDRASRDPLGRQIYLQVREHILAGRLAAGARLPSTRKLATDLQVSRIVTLAAYEQLWAEGYVESRPGSGQYVRSIRPATGFARPPTSETPRAPNPAVGSGATPAETPGSRGLPFDPVSQPSVFPLRAWSKLMARGWRREGHLAQGPVDWAGMASLRAAIARHVQAFRGIECGPENLFITSGNTDALQMIVRALGEPGGARAQVWVEDPGHLAGRRALEREGLQAVAVPVDDQGLDVAAGERLAPDARFALITPSRQFPLGMPLALPRRLALIDWARERGGVLIEDDYDSEVRFSGHPIPSLLSLAGGAQALAIGSLSKLTFPALRLGYIVGAEALVRRFSRRRALEGAPIATAAQPALAEFISSGAFTRHIRTLRPQVTERRRLLIGLLQRDLSHRLTVLPQEVGMHLTVTLKSDDRGSDIELAARGAEVGLYLDPLSAHTAATTVRPGFLLGYAGWDEAELAVGVERLATLLN